jgi:hypothetical protein
MTKTTSEILHAKEDKTIGHARRRLRRTGFITYEVAAKKANGLLNSRRSFRKIQTVAMNTRRSNKIYRDARQSIMDCRYSSHLLDGVGLRQRGKRWFRKPPKVLCSTFPA